MLSEYLRDHAAAARAGITVAGRTRKHNEGTEFEDPLIRFHRELVGERASLERFMEVLGCRSSTVKDTFGSAGAWLGQLKFSGGLTSYSPVGRVLEFEALIGAVNAKRRLWETVRFVESDGSLPTGELMDLIEAADRQVAELDRLHRMAITIVVSGDSASKRG